MRAILTEATVTGDKAMTSAHASSTGVSLVTHNYLDGTQIVELASVFRYACRALPIFPKAFFRGLDEARLDEIDEEYREERSHYQEMMDLSRYRAFGDSSNVNELAEENIPYDIRGEEIPFLAEELDFSKHDEKDDRKIILPGEIRGFSEVYNQNSSKNDLPEPFTIDEGLSFVKKLNPSCDVTIEEVSNTPSVDMWLRPEFSDAVELLKSLMKKMEEAREDPEMLLLFLEISEEDWRRAKITASRDSLGADWCWQSFNNIGAREGTTEDQSRQNDRNYTTQEQYHTLGERVDGKFVLSEELEHAAKKDMVLVWSMYYAGGEEKPDGTVAYKGENKGWTERSVYFMRCAAERNEVFADKLWHILTWPLDIVESCMEALRHEYKQSVKQHRAGPGRQKVDGRWTTAPLVGKEAIAHIKRVGVGGLKGKKINKDARLFTGAEWHKLFLNREHLNALEDAILWRKGVVKLSIGEETVEEQFNQTVSSLPRDYVLNTYGRRS